MNLSTTIFLQFVFSVCMRLVISVFMSMTTAVLIAVPLQWKHWRLHRRPESFCLCGSFHVTHVSMRVLPGSSRLLPHVRLIGNSEHFLHAWMMKVNGWPWCDAVSSPCLGVVQPSPLDNRHRPQQALLAPPTPTHPPPSLSANKQW